MRVELNRSLSILLICAALQATAAFAMEPMPAAPPQPDPVSTKCLGCHDGTNGAQAEYCLMAGGSGGSSGHVISGDYARAAGSNPGLKPPQNLPAAIVLFEGQVTCVTCHGSQPHEGAPLAIDNTASALCLACHRI